MRDPATRPAKGDRIVGSWGERRVAWVTEGLAHTIIGLVDDLGRTTAVGYREWVELVHEADLIFAAGSEEA